MLLCALCCACVGGAAASLQVRRAAALPTHLRALRLLPCGRACLRAGGGSKIAVLETGASIQVPLFINTGEKIKIDTRTETYLSRA